MKRGTIMTVTRADFCADRHGRRFADVVSDTRYNFDEWLEFFSDSARQLRMEVAEAHLCIPALGGVIRELERHPAFAYLAKYDAHETQRGRQAIGVIVRIVMERRGWSTTGRKGALGRRLKSAPGTTTPGAYRNGPASLSVWFTRSEHYAHPDSLLFNCRI